MAGWLIVLLKTVSSSLVIAAGWAARRRGLLTGETTRTLSRFTVDVALPAMVLGSMIRTTSAVELRAGWATPVLGALVLLAGYGVGRVAGSLLAPPAVRPTFVFLVMVPNWIYLPLPIATAAYGEAGVRAILLFNVGALALMWTLGVRTLRPGRLDRAALRELASNPGLVSTVLAVAAVLTVGAWPKATAQSSAPWLAGECLLQALEMLGSLTVPLSLVVTGAQLGELDLAGSRPSAAVLGAVVARMIVAPVLTILLIFLMFHAGWDLPETSRRTSYIISTMPPAVSCSIFAQRFGGDTRLAALAIVYGTLLALLTGPVFYYWIVRLGL